MEEKKTLILGGSLQKAMAGDFALDLKGLINEAWALTQKTKWVMVQAMLLVFSLALLAVLILANLAQFKGLDLMAPNVQLMTEILLTLLTAPLITGLMMMGINHAVGGQSRPSHLFHFLPKALILSLSALLVSLLVELGLLLFIVPGLFLMIACSFTLPLVIEKGLTPMRAIFVSIRVVSFKWQQFVLLYLLFALLFVLVIATFGIAFIWVGPFYYNMKGVLYRDIFGVAVRLTGQDGASQNGESIFHA
ncbi:hypothetical protein [Bowmanella yangjiangensis]|uniref:Uncharacterized protein n=1 Tax=Bowmanella yangjiangensis TaxID=2811230 RepID=A0ABS3CU48_9ALTE|nr:hypothetical protein [Bowmanella yangjiangensis]MBN7820648.1 hypothetical protein [Bowmanella yangjiangensis]